MGDYELSPEEQRFLSEETTNRQVVQGQDAAAAMVEAEKAKAENWVKTQEELHEEWRQKRQEWQQAAVKLADDRHEVSVQWATAGTEKALRWLEAAQARAAANPTAEARAYVLRYLQHLDGWQSTVRLYESRVWFYRMNDHWADILLATENYPERGNPYYWNKKGMPKLRKLREWTDIQVTRRDRNGLWPFPEEADKWI